MSPLRILLAVLLAGGISIGTAILGQRWLTPPAETGLALEQGRARLEFLPEFRLRDLAGAEVPFTSWPGRILVLHYWASWCPPCGRELPLLDELQSRLGASGVQIVGIAVDRPEDAAAFVAAHPVGYPILIATPGAVALAKRLGNRIEGLPFTVIFDRRGRRVFSQTGALTDGEIERQLEPLLERRILGLPVPGGT